MKRSAFNNSWKYGIVLVFAISLCSCRKFVAIDPPPDLVRTQNVFQNDNTALAAASHIYIEMNITGQRFSYAGMSTFAAFAADEMHSTFEYEVYDAFIFNTLNEKDETIQGNFWDAAYRIIYYSNAVIEGVNASASLSAGVKGQLVGEMKTVRAFCYFYLVNLFGDVPLVTSTDYKINQSLPRAAVTTVYQQIVSDLLEAQSLLKESYPSPGKVRPNKLTATALLARVYLYLRDWANAEIQAAAVINSNLYSLVPDLNNVFAIESPETIWETAPNDESRNNPFGGYIPNDPAIRPPFVLNTSLLDAFEPGDQRKLDWVGKNTVDGTPPVDYYYPHKYKQPLPPPVKEYNPVLRLDEQYLIRAEARTQLGKLPEAQDDLNIIRTRAGLPNTTSATMDELLTAILQERRVELFTEWGHRWLDLKRTGTIDAVMSVEKGADWQSADALFPIPYNELLYNPALTQNPGY